ncbi:MAG: glycosyltransferase family 2 protein [Kiritimatiellae bacterium]|nr:glycosyltransferase family 2 protein [Kiritimatiellia bacterium]
MKIYGVSVVQDEADVIRDSVAWAARFCDRIWIWDLGSRDGTWEILQELQSRQVGVARREDLPYSSSLRGEVFKAYREHIEDGSWVYILDADEFLVGDPRPVLAAAEREGTGMVGVWQANFFPTERDLEKMDRMGEEVWSGLPLADRLRHYRVEWFEWRFTRVVPEMVWDTSGPYNAIRLPDGETMTRSRHKMVVRHYRYRSPQQVATRYALRGRDAEGVPRRFRYDITGDFREVVRPSRRCRLWRPGDAELRVPVWELWRARVAMTATRVRRRAGRRAGDVPQGAEGVQPVYNFLFPVASDEELVEMSRKDVDRDWALFRKGEYAWSLQTYLVLKERGLPVACSRGLRKYAVNLGHVMTLSGVHPDPEAFTVAMRADYPRLAWAQMHIVQNKAQARGRRSLWVPHWPQPGLIGRDPARRGVRTAAYVGRSWMQAGRAEKWAEALGAIGVEFRMLTDAWNDLSKIDVLIAIRSFSGRTCPTKPPTKLINAWHAGIPLVAGRDSAFAQTGTPGEDYLVATTLREAVQAVRRLKEDPALYEAIVARGRRKAEQFTREEIAKTWAILLKQQVVPRYLEWARHGGCYRLAYTMRVAWDHARRRLRSRIKAFLRQT